MSFYCAIEKLAKRKHGKRYTDLFVKMDDSLSYDFSNVRWEKNKLSRCFFIGIVGNKKHWQYQILMPDFCICVISEVFE